MLSRILGRTKDPHDEDAKPVTAKMGTKNKMYYNAELKRWVMPGQEASIAKETAARDAPPPETEGEPTPPTRPSGLSGRYPLPAFVKTKEAPSAVAYSRPLRPLPVADEAIPDAPENLPSVKSEYLAGEAADQPPPWHEDPRPSLQPPDNLAFPPPWEMEVSPALAPTEPSNPPGASAPHDPNDLGQALPEPQQAPDDELAWNGGQEEAAWDPEAQGEGQQPPSWAPWPTMENEADAPPVQEWSRGEANEEEPKREQAEAADACSSGSRNMPSPREEARRSGGAALPPLMPNATRRGSAAAQSHSESVAHQDDLNSSSGWDSVRISQSNIHRASQRASSRHLYRTFMSPSIGQHEYRKSRQPSPSLSGLIYRQRRSSSLNRPAMSYDRSRSPPETPKQDYQGSRHFPDKASRTATMMSQYAPSANGDSNRHLHHSRRCTLDNSADHLTRVMHLRSARRNAVSDLPARKESEKKDLESMGLLEEALHLLTSSPEVLSYLSVSDANESISQLLHLESLSDSMRNQLMKLSALLKPEKQEQSHLPRPPRLDQDFEAIVESLKLRQKSDNLSQLRQMTYRLQEGAHLELAGSGLPTGDFFVQISEEEDASIQQLESCVRTLIKTVAETKATSHASDREAELQRRIDALEVSLAREKALGEAMEESFRVELGKTKEQLALAEQRSADTMRFVEGMQGLDASQGDAQRRQFQVEKNLLESEIEDLQMRNEGLQAELEAAKFRTEAEITKLTKQVALLEQAADQDIDEVDRLREELHQLKSHDLPEAGAELLQRGRDLMSRIGESFDDFEDLARLTQEVLAEREAESERLSEVKAGLQDVLLRVEGEQTESLRAEITEEVRVELEAELLRRRSEVEDERRAKESELRSMEEALAEREKELATKSVWMESEVQKLAKYALALQTRSAAFSDWQEKALAASKVLQGRMRQLNQKVISMNRQLAARGAPLIDLSLDQELEAAQKFVHQDALKQQEQGEKPSREVDSHETTLHLSSSEIVSM